LTDERRPAPEPTAPVGAGPADPDEAKRLARRRFLRSLASDAMKTAATVVGAAGALRESSAGMASALLGSADTAIAPVEASVAATPEPSTGFRSPFRFEPEQVVLLDQRGLPDELIEVVCVSGADVAQAMRESVVRGAPLLGQVAACGLALTAGRSRASGPHARRAILFGTANALRNAAPTAAPVRNAMDRMLARFAACGDQELDVPTVAEALRDEAEAIVNEAVTGHARLAAHGAAFFASDLPAGAGGTLRILTIGSTGALAGGQVGTALGVVRAVRDAGRDVRVLVAETRPWLAGSRLVAWELAQAGIPFTLVGDGAAAGLLARGEADAVIVGPEAIALNGDVACDPGSYGLAVVAERHAIPFYVAAPLSTCDREAADGRALRAEPRPSAELLSLGGRRIAPEGTSAVNPSIDVIPAELVTAIVTEAGVLRAPYATALAAAARAATAAMATTPTPAATTVDADGVVPGPTDQVGAEA
jgi:methylthioribose-1-phosphate isomerase